MNKKVRESNIELCRLVCMALIIAHHCVLHGGAVGMELCTNKYISFVLLPGGKLCFDAFLAISTWFMVDQKFKSERFLKTWLQVLFYSVVFAIVAVCMGAEFQWYHWMSAFFPITGNSHGFAASYLAFYLLLPFLGMISEKVNKKQAQWIMLLLLYFQVFSKILGVIHRYTQPISSELTLFILFYFISLYLKRYPLKLLQKWWVCLLGVIICWGLAVYMYLGSCILRPGKEIWGYLGILYGDESSILNIIGGIFLFQLFRNIKMPSIKVINFLAGTTFGMLLIHDHNFFRPYCWYNVFHTPDWWYSNKFIIRVGFCVFCIFVAGAIIDTLRKYLLEKPIFSIPQLKKILNKCDGVLLIGKDEEGSEKS